MSSAPHEPPLAQSGAAPGMVAPPLQVGAILNGEPVELAGWRGEVTLLLFWNIGCAGCTGRALPFARDLAHRFPDLRLLAIHSAFGSHATQPAGAIQQLIDYFALPYPIALDRGDATFRAYHAEGTPHWVLLDPEGRIYRTIFGSMENARQRLLYALQEFFPEPASPG